jgi:hypothetical protein
MIPRISNFLHLPYNPPHTFSIVNMSFFHASLRPILPIQSQSKVFVNYHLPYHMRIYRPRPCIKSWNDLDAKFRLCFGKIILNHYGFTSLAAFYNFVDISEDVDSLCYLKHNYRSVEQHLINLVFILNPQKQHHQKEIV